MTAVNKKNLWEIIKLKLKQLSTQKRLIYLPSHGIKQNIVIDVDTAQLDKYANIKMQEFE